MYYPQLQQPLGLYMHIHIYIYIYLTTCIAHNTLIIQYTCIPELIPIRRASFSLGRCLILNLLRAERKWSAIVEISSAWRLPLLIGSPLATIYASPMVSTYQKKSKCKWTKKKDWIDRNICSLIYHESIALTQSFIHLHHITLQIWLFILTACLKLMQMMNNIDIILHSIWTFLQPYQPLCRPWMGTVGEFASFTL